MTSPIQTCITDPSSGEILTCETKGSDRWAPWSSPSTVHFLAVWMLARPYLCWRLSTDSKAVPGWWVLRCPDLAGLKDGWGCVHGDVSGLRVTAQKQGTRSPVTKTCFLAEFPLLPGCIWVQSGEAQGGWEAGGTGDSRESKYKFHAT